MLREAIITIISLALLQTGVTLAKAPSYCSDPRDSDFEVPNPLSTHMNEVQRFNRTINEKPAQVGCTDGAVNHEDLEMALECLSAWCEVNQIPPHTGEHCIVGDSMMYMCSYGDYNPCSADEIVTAWGAIQRDCGTNRGGWWHFHDWKKTYGVDVSGADVCSNM